MMEIYNEKIRDLLNPDPKTNNDLKVRTTPKGTFVEGVKSKAVGSFKAISDTMDAGTSSRTVAATQMNATSSRAHTVMTISIKQISTVDGRTREVGSDMNLVDLAGSERAESTGATGDRLKEGAAINKSLSALGNVISALAEQVCGRTSVHARVSQPGASDGGRVKCTWRGMRGSPTAKAARRCSSHTATRS